MKAILELCRFSNAPTCVTNVLVGAAVATGGGMPWMRVGLACVAIIALYVMGMVLNDVLDIEADRVERPQRPLPSGRVSLGAAWMLAVGAAAFGLGVLAALGRHAVFAGVGLLVLIVAYDALHKRFAWSVVLMGGCRALVYVVAALACGVPLAGDAPLGLAAFAAAMGLYIVGLSIVARLEAAPQRAPRKWPALILPAIVLAPLIVVPGANVALAAAGLVMTVLWLLHAARQAMARPPRVPAAVMAWLAGICLVDATFLAHLGAGPVALVAVACFVLTRWGHRHILGT